MNQGQNFGSYVPTTNIWDPTQLLNVDVTSPEFKELLVRLYQNLNLMSVVLNTKDSGLYVTEEFVCGQVYFPDPSLTSQSSTVPNLRNVFRTVVDFGEFPNAATKSVAHNINPTSGFTFTRIYGAASDTTDLLYIPLPYAGGGTNDVVVSVDATNVNIQTFGDMTNYNASYVILEYLKF